jgi:hypothetical protein
MDTTTETKKTNGTTHLHVKVPKKTEQPKEIELEGIETQSAIVSIFSRSQLIVNNFGSKGVQQMEDQRALSQEEKKALKKHGKPPITPEEIERRFQNARLLDSKGRDCIKADWIKGALVTAGKSPDIGIHSTQLRGIVYVEGDLIPIEYAPKPASESNEIITYWGTSKHPGIRHPEDKLPTPGMRRDVVRVGKRGSKDPDIRYRPCYDDWSVTFRLVFEPKQIPVKLLYHLIRRAGTSVGLCEWRPEGPGGKGGQFGRFDLKVEGAQ